MYKEDEACLFKTEEEIVNCVTNIFADDTSIYDIGETRSEIISSLQSAVTSLSEWFSEWVFEVNASKPK